MNWFWIMTALTVAPPGLSFVAVRHLDNAELRFFNANQEYLAAAVKDQPKAIAKMNAAAKCLASPTGSVDFRYRASTASMALTR